MYRLETLGYSIGQKLIEMISCRDRATKRETRLVGMLQYVSNVLWKHLFGKAADNLERSMENEDECRFHRLTLSLSRCISPPAHTQHSTPPPQWTVADMIHENSPVTNTFVSVPADMGHLNCAAFIAGIIAGALDSARFVRLPPPSMCGGGKLDSFS